MHTSFPSSRSHTHQSEGIPSLAKPGPGRTGLSCSGGDLGGGNQRCPCRENGARGQEGSPAVPGHCSPTRSRCPRYRLGEAACRAPRAGPGPRSVLGIGSCRGPAAPPRPHLPRDAVGHTGDTRPIPGCCCCPRRGSVPKPTVRATGTPSGSRIEGKEQSITCGCPGRLRTAAPGSACRAPERAARGDGNERPRSAHFCPGSQRSSTGFARFPSPGPAPTVGLGAAPEETRESGRAPGDAELGSVAAGRRGSNGAAPAQPPGRSERDPGPAEPLGAGSGPGTGTGIGTGRRRALGALSRGHRGCGSGAAPSP